MNRFEEYLKEHKEKFGTIEVDPIIWPSIENQLLRKNNHRLRLYIRITASFLIMFFSVATVKYFFFNPRTTSQLSLSRYSPELSHIEKDFQKAILYQTDKIRNLEISRSYEPDFIVLINEIKELDKQYKKYIDISERYGFNEDLGNKILEYYNLKLQLLKKIQFEIIKINNFKKDSNYENNKVHIQI